MGTGHLRAKGAVIVHLDDRLASLQAPPFKAGVKGSYLKRTSSFPGSPVL
ncbi:MAG: hypothetical protein PVI06_11855 [Desulfobacterales bacterium]|jgi:hypothetical protein